MRLRLEFKLVHPPPQSLPVNYQYPVSAWIYKTIASGNHAFADFLHQRGFGSNNKTFKFFTFSWLSFPPRGFKVLGDRLMMLQPYLSLEVSFMVPDAVHHFVTGLFMDQMFALADNKSKLVLQVVNVQVLSIPMLSGKQHYHSVSPVLLSRPNPDKRAAEYLHPADPDYEGYFVRNLISRYDAARKHGLVVDHGTIEPDQLHFEAGQKPALLKGLTIKANTPAQTKLKAYHFGFGLHAPDVIHHIGYHSGFGEKNSLGLGYVQWIDSAKSTK